MVTSFLCTRVTRATDKDMVKLGSVLGHLKAMQEKTLVLKPKGVLMVD
jgi:fructose-1-phosphate kinase PfkB-like protein